MSTKLDIYTTKRRGRIKNMLFTSACFLATITCVLMLMVLIWNIILQGKDWLSWGFIDHLPSRFPHKAGIKSALWGSIWLISLTAMFSVPLGTSCHLLLPSFKVRFRSFLSIYPTCSFLIFMCSFNTS